MKRAFILLAAAAVALPFAYANAHGSSAAKKTSICHRTANKKTPYVKLTVSAKQLKGHLKHAADIIPAPRGACPKTILTPTSGGTELSAVLTGEAETPAGDPVATGTATVRLRAGQGQACFTLNAKNLPSPAVAAHMGSSCRSSRRTRTEPRAAAWSRHARSSSRSWRRRRRSTPTSTRPGSPAVRSAGNSTAAGRLGP
jgi:hypothetical protein